MPTKCYQCGTRLEDWEGVNCHGYDLCDDCYESHTPNVGAYVCVGESDELID